MPVITKAPTQMANGDMVTEFVDSVGTTERTYTFLSQQNYLYIENNGNSAVTVKVSGMSFVVNPYKSVKEKIKFTSFTVTSSKLTQQINVRTVNTKDNFIEALAEGRQPKQYGNIVSALGDSHTANAGNENQRLSKSYFNWLGIYSEGVIRLQTQLGASGYTSERVYKEKLVEFLNRAEYPNYCLVLLGTNDAGQNVPLSTTAYYLTQIYDELLSNDIMPIPCTPPPRPVASGMQRATIKIGEWVRDTAQKRKLPLVDFYSALADPATGAFKAGYSDDGIHANGLGGKVMGKVAWESLKNIFTPWKVPLCVSNNDPTNIFTNGLFLTDSNSDGMPDGINRLSATTIRETTELLPGSGDVVGNWFKVTRTNTSGSTSQRSVTIAVTPGHKYFIALRMKIEGLTGTGGNINASVIKAGAGTTILRNIVYIWDTDIENGVFYGEFTVPDDITQIQFDYVISAAAPVDSSFYFAQLTIKDLTSLSGDA